MEKLHQYLRHVKRVNPDADLKLIEKAYKYAYVAHEGQKRRTGEPYFNHLYRVAQYILDMGIPDTASICASFLHDIAEDTDVGLRAITNEFTKEIESLVEGLTKINKKFFDTIKEYEVENRRKILLATARDPRVIFIKLCDRLDNLHDLSIFREEKQKRIAQDTMDMYAPIADKIGASALQARLEDQSMRYLYPQEYNTLRQKITQSRKQRDQYITTIVKEVQALLEQNNIEVISIVGRAKAFYSIYKKMKDRDKSFDQLRDLYGIRIVTKHNDQCYAVHKVLKEKWHHYEEHFKDYIKRPRSNGYQALQANFLIDDRVIEVQVRTSQMDAHAEFGAAIHWKYKGTEKSKKFDQKLTWVREFVKWMTMHKKGEGRELTIDVFKDQIIALTPKGDPIILNDKATALDFAFSVHTRVGEYAKSITVNGKQVPLTTVLKSGDIVEVHTQRSKAVQQQWLRIVKTNEAKAKIRKALGIEGDVTSPKQARAKDKREQDVTMLVDLQHMKGMPKLKLSKCCNPKRGQDIVAFYTKDKKFITVHRANCPNQYALDQSRKIELAWSKRQKKGQRLDILLDPQKSGLITTSMRVLFEQGVPVRHIVTKDTRNNIKLSVDIDPVQKDIQQEVEKILTTRKGILDVHFGKK